MPLGTSTTPCSILMMFPSRQAAAVLSRWHDTCITVHTRHLYLQHTGANQLHLGLHSTQRAVLRHLRTGPEARHDAALRVLRRRATRWDAEVPDALDGAYFHFSSTRPPARLCLHASALFAALDVRLPVLATRQLLAFSGAVALAGTANPTISAVRSSATGSTLTASASSVAQFIRCLTLPLLLCKRTAMAVDIAFWAADRVRNGRACAPRSLFATRLRSGTLGCAILHVGVRSRSPTTMHVVSAAALEGSAGPHPRPRK